jgi:3-dehydroquinate dehydratase-1
MLFVTLGNMDKEQLLVQVKKYDNVEIRFDLLPELSLDDIKEVVEAGKNIIATCRGGKLSLDDRINILKAAVKAGANFIDLEYKNDQSVLDKLYQISREYNCQTIISYHDYDKTPSYLEIKHQLADMLDMKTAYVKLAVNTRTNDEIDRLFDLFKDFNNKNIVLVPMSDDLPEARVESLFLGSAFMYVAPDDIETNIAPGMISFSEFQKLAAM